MNTNQSFDNYAALMKKRKMTQTMHNNMNSTSLLGSKGKKDSSNQIDQPIVEEEDEGCLKIKKNNPQARDGHTAVIL